MPHSPILFENLPINARLADERGVVRHVCDAVQPTYDNILQALDQLESLANPDTTPVEFLDWFQQIVALAPVGDRILGLGLDPDWEPLHKREVIKRAWRYWQTKGTGQGIRDALAMWFQWEEARTEPAVLIRLPWGDRPSATPPQWWGYTTRYDAWPTQTWDQRQLLGSGDYPQRYTPDWTIVQTNQNPWGYDDQFDQDFAERSVGAIASPGSILGPHAVWEHLTPGVDRWNDLFPGIDTLNEESWDIQARVGVFGWIDGGTTEPLVARRSPITRQTETVYDVEIIGFRYTDVFPFGGVELEAARQTLVADAVVVRDTVAIQSSDQAIASDTFTIESFFIDTPESSAQTLAADAAVVRDTLAIATTNQAIAADAAAVQSSFTTEPMVAHQTVAASEWRSRDSFEILTAAQSIVSDAAVVRNTVAIMTTKQAIAAAATAVQSSFTTVSTTTVQTLEAADFLVLNYDWFYHNIVI